MLKRLKFLEKRIVRLAVPELTINPHNSPEYEDIKQMMGKGKHTKLFL